MLEKNIQHVLRILNFYWSGIDNLLKCDADFNQIAPVGVLNYKTFHDKLLQLAWQ
jgi:hypothetical protein